MIYKKGTRYPTSAVYAIYQDFLAVITSIHHGANLIWQMVKSCYGTGIWLPAKPWTDNDKWKDHK